jgi:hypothetical protein
MLWVLWWAMLGASRRGWVARVILAAAMLAVLSLSDPGVRGYPLHPASWEGHQSHGLIVQLAPRGSDPRVASISGDHFRLGKARTRHVLQYGLLADGTGAIPHLAYITT